MIDLKLDEGSAIIFVEYLKKMITDNPIILQNILEPHISKIITELEVYSKDQVGDVYSTENIKDIIQEEINKRLDQGELTGALDVLLEKRVNDHDVNETFESKIDDLISDSGVDKDDVINIIREEAKKMLDQNRNQIPGLQDHTEVIAEGEGYDIIKIRCKTSLSPSFMWMIQNLVDKNSIEIVTAGS